MANTDLEERCNALRAELKVWEKKFAAAHEGRKAGRDDIKADGTISQKYKEYRKLRDALSGEAAPQTPSRRPSSRDHSHDTYRTPTARRSFAPTANKSTPQKRKREDDVNCLEVVASPGQVLSPQGPAFIGPTPQRDGLVLGLFDLLPAGTPSKPRMALDDVAPNLLQTPSRKRKAESDGSFESRGRHEKTPLSTGKRFLLDQFVTPKKLNLREATTPISALKGLSTPAFLRRDNRLHAIDEASEPTPRPAPWKRKGLGRSLSSIIQSMRKEEEDRLDEEAEIMREMEMEGESVPQPGKETLSKAVVEDSQVTMPLGPDRGAESEDGGDNEAEQLGPDGKPLRVWKKRGLKRQTRRVIMRPHFTKPDFRSKPMQTEKAENEVKGNYIQEQDRVGSVSADEFQEVEEESDYASDDSHSRKKRKVQGKTAVEAAQKDGKPRETGAVKLAARKIKATAHANYRKLKIKSKGGNGGKGRFGRRR